MITWAKLNKLRELIVKASASLSDTDALNGVELFAVWASDTDYAVGDRVSYEGTLYKCRQSHTSQSIYTPDMIPALWEVVAEPGQGDTPDNPIPYNNNMELFEGKYYSQYDVTYICTRSTGTAVYNDLADLVHIYVEVYG